MEHARKLACAEKILVGDGAVGPLLRARGIPHDGTGFCVTANLTHPMAVLDAHREFVEAGAEVITANTQAAARHILEPLYLGQFVQRINVLGVQLAREAAEETAPGRRVRVAGAMTALGPGIGKKQGMGAAAAASCYWEQARALSMAGADMLVATMVGSMEQAILLGRAARGAGLPLWMALHCRTRFGGGLCLAHDMERLETALSALRATFPGMVCLIHGRVENPRPAARALEDTQGMLHGVYAVSGKFSFPDWTLENQASAADFAKSAEQWVSAGAQAVCGGFGVTGPCLRAARKEKTQDFRLAPGRERVPLLHLGGHASRGHAGYHESPA